MHVKNGVCIHNIDPKLILNKPIEIHVRHSNMCISRNWDAKSSYYQ